MNAPVSRRYQSVQLFIHYAHAIGSQTATGNGIWTKLRLGTGICYTPLQDHLIILLLSYISTRTVVQIVHLKSRLSLIVRAVVVDSDWRFDNLCGSYLQSQSELYHVSWWYYTPVIDLIGLLRRDVIGRLSVKPWCYWLWRLVSVIGAFRSVYCHS